MGDDQRLVIMAAARYTPIRDLWAILWLLRRGRCRSLLEIGTNEGRTTRAVLDHFPGMRIVTIDPGDQIEPAARAAAQAGEYPAQERIGRLVAGEPTVTIIRSAFADADLAGERFDAAFIDGDHRAAAVRHDTRKALSHLNPGGLIIWHDLGNVPDVALALAQMEIDYIVIESTWIGYARLPNPRRHADE